MKLIDITFETVNYSYKSAITFPSHGTFTIKFDTGAVKTIISAELIYGELTKEQRLTINNYCSSKITPEVFTSATGHTVFAYPVEATNVLIGDTQFDKFLYYLVVDELANGKQISLLGSNFIDCCKFEHDIHKGIHITAFDLSKYDQSIQSIPLNEISSILTAQ